ncbi:ABC transporter ATP-binding protein [Gemmatimonadota bacterium]
MSVVLKVQALRKCYRQFTLNSIDLEVQAGSILGIIGPNGAGKTTLVRLIMNQIKPDGGTVHVFDFDHKDSEKEIKNRIGYVGEEQFFYRKRTVDWTGRFVGGFFRDWDQARFVSLLEEFNISGSKKTGELSKGMKTKLALAIALSHGADLLILDEPTSGLDPIVRREVLDHLQEVARDEDKTVVLSSHISDDLSRIADHLAFLNDGEIILRGDKDDILSQWKRIHFREGSLDQGVLGALEGVRSMEFSNAGVCRNFPEIQTALASGVASGDVRVKTMSLDDILLFLVNGK